MVTKLQKSSDFYLIHPGETLAELLQERKMKQNELAIRTGLSKKHINQIINGKESISCETAVKLEQVLGLSASFWNSLEAQYCAEKIKLNQRDTISENELELLKKIRYKELVKYKYLINKTDLKERVIQIRDLWGVSDLIAINKLAVDGLMGFAFRKSQSSLNVDIYSMYTWFKICELSTKTCDNDLNLDKLRGVVPEIKRLIISCEINEAIIRLKEIFACCGIAFSVVHNLPGAPVQGMIKKVNNKAALHMTIRNKYADIFWFTLFHEIAHLLFDDYNKPFVDFEYKGDDYIEKRADKFASNQLIDEKAYQAFLKQKDFYKPAIIEFAKKQNVIPGIVVGRLQHDGVIPRSWNNDLRRQYEWGE